MRYNIFFLLYYFCNWMRFWCWIWFMIDILVWNFFFVIFCDCLVWMIFIVIIVFEFGRMLWYIFFEFFWFRSLFWLKFFVVLLSFLYENFWGLMIVILLGIVFWLKFWLDFEFCFMYKYFKLSLISSRSVFVLLVVVL